jgi:hypothetical protein
VIRPHGIGGDMTEARQEPQFRRWSAMNGSAPSRPRPRLAAEADVLRRRGAAQPPTPLQWTALGIVTTAPVAALILWPAVAGQVLHHLVFLLFLVAALMRLAAALTPRTRVPTPPLPDAALPAYTVIAPLYREAEVVPQLLEALAAIDYPRSRLQVLVVVEADDAFTREALVPFPLGGTSNHFRVDVLRAVGGWDAWNVTEDADLGFRLWSHGWTLGVMARPTWEAPPGGLAHWLPQRTRWLKGYLQTWGVHTRTPWRLGWRGILALAMTLGAGLVSAAIHGLTLAWVAATVLVSFMAGLPPETPVLALCVLVLGTASAWLSCAIGARRAGAPYGAGDMIRAPGYWALLSLAFAHAAWRLVVDPFAWDKTPHRRDPAVEADSPAADCETHDMLDATAPLRLSAGHAAAPQPVA